MSENLQEVQTDDGMAELSSWEEAGVEESIDESTEDIPESFEELADSESETESEDIEAAPEATEEDGKPAEELSSEEGSETVQASSEGEGTDEESGTEEADKVGETIKVKVDGEEVDVSLEDLKSNYSGKVAYDKKFNELNVERKSFESEITEVNNYINHFGTLMKDGKAIEAMSYFAEFGGMAPHDFKQQLFKAMLPEFERLQQLSPEQIDSEYTKEANDYYKSQLESKEQESLKQQADQELSLKESGLREAHGFTNEEWDQASAYVKEHLQNANDYSPELIRDFMVNEKAENAIEAVDASLLDNKVFMSAFETLVFENPDASHDDLVEHLQSLYEEKVEEPKKEQVKQELTKKVKQTKQTTKKEKVTIEPIKDEYGNEAEDWDDIL